MSWIDPWSLNIEEQESTLTSYPLTSTHVLWLVPLNTNIHTEKEQIDIIKNYILDFLGKEKR